MSDTSPTPETVAEIIKLRSTLATAEAVMRRALSEVEHEEARYVLNLYFEATGEGR